MNSVIEKAEELGMVILNSNEFTELNEAQDKLDNNPEAQKLIQDFQEKQSNLHQVHHNGEEVSEEEIGKLQDLQKAMMDNDLINDYVTAKHKADKLISSVSQVLTKTVGVPFGGGSGHECGGGCC